MQIPLALTPKLLYAAENFVVHGGVQAVIHTCLHLAAADGYGIVTISGPPRSGKSHLAVYLMDRLARCGHYPQLIDGTSSFTNNDRVSSDEVTLVDNFDSILAECSSADFVAFVEKRRAAGAKVFLFATTLPDSSAYDEHTMSRVRSAVPLEITQPMEEDLPMVFDALARQRGFALTQRNVQFLMRRLRRDIASMEEYVRRLERLSLVRSMQLRRELIHDAVG